MTSLITDLWLDTDEWIPSVDTSTRLARPDLMKPNVQPRHQEGTGEAAAGHQEEATIRRVHFAVGLWTVCPSHEDASLKGSKLEANGNPKNYQESNYACSSISISRILDTSDLSWRQELGLWSPAYNTFRIIDNIRICGLFAIGSLALLMVSTLLATLGHCVRGHKMLLASGLYALGGLLLGCCLLILVCTISEEFGSAGGGGGRSHLGGSRSKLSSTASSSPLKSESGMISHGYFGSSGGSRDQYSYGWSFILATLGFLGSELSALLCLAAFLNRFDSEEDFIKMLPGMERRLTEHMMVHHCAASETSGRSLQEVPLLKGSFGHHSAMGSSGLGNSSSQESLYGNQRHHIMTSGSLHSIRSANNGSRAIPVTAEIVPVPTMLSSAEPTNVTLVSSSSSSFMPPTASEAAVTSNNPHCTVSLENGYGYHAQQQPQRLQSVNSRLASSPILVDTHARSSNVALAMATMPRNVHHNQQNGSSWSPPPPPLPPHQQPPPTQQLSGTLPNFSAAKKKSVTIGTFTTVVEPFEISEEENMISSAV